MSLESIAHLAELTGKAPETIKKAAGALGLKPVVDGRRRLYESKRVLPYIYGRATAEGGAESPSGQALDFNTEKTKLTFAQRQKVELETAEKAGELVKVEDAVDFMAGVITNAKTRLLAMPTKAAPELAIQDEPAACAKIVRSFVIEALDELAEFRP